MSHKKIIIIGAGPGGLASAMLLASSGCQVQVIERSSQVGGRTSYLESGDFRFDRGPTFFLYPEVLQGIFQMCGRRLADEIELIRLDPNYRLAFEEGPSVDACSDRDRLRNELAKLSPDDAQQLDRYIEDNRDKLNSFRPILESPFNSHRDLFKLPLRKLFSTARPWASVDSDLSKYFKDPRVRLALSFQSKYLGMSPFKCPSLFTILAFLEYEYGVFHPRGGCAAVSKAMRRVATEMGVEFSMEETVEALDFTGRKVTGVRTDRGNYKCDAIVVNADFAGAMQQLVPDSMRTRWSNKKIAKKKMSCSTFMMYLGIDGQYDELMHHTIFLSKNYEQNLADIEKRFRLPDNPSFYIHNPSLIDDSMAPKGSSSLYILVPVPHEHPNINWHQQRAPFRELVLNQLSKVGLSNIRQRIITEKVVTPANWSADMNLYKGATFSLAHSLNQMLSFRPRNRFEELDGVYLVGGGTHPGSGLPVIFESAKISSQLLLSDLGLRHSWNTSPSAKPQDWSVLAGESA